MNEWTNLSEQKGVNLSKRHRPVAFILLWDDELYLEPYISREIGRTCPTFVIRRNKYNEDAFIAFSNYAEKVLSIAPEKKDRRRLDANRRK